MAGGVGNGGCYIPNCVAGTRLYGDTRLLMTDAPQCPEGYTISDKRRDLERDIELALEDEDWADVAQLRSQLAALRPQKCCEASDEAHRLNYGCCPR